MKSTSCISCQAKRQVRLGEEKGKVLGSSAKIKKNKIRKFKNPYIHTYKEITLSCSFLSKLISISFYIW
jgi:hypothetical protein